MCVYILHYSGSGVVLYKYYTLFTGRVVRQFRFVEILRGIHNVYIYIYMREASVECTCTPCALSWCDCPPPPPPPLQIQEELLKEEKKLYKTNELVTEVFGHGVHRKLAVAPIQHWIKKGR